MKEVFDFEVYSAEGLLFKTKTVNMNSIHRNFETGENTLVIEDALLDDDVFNKIFSGDCNNKYLRIVGKGIIRDTDCVDTPVRLELTVTKLREYSFYTSCDTCSLVDIVFDFPSRDCYGFANMRLVIE